MVTTLNKIVDEVKNINWKFASENIDDDLHTDVLFMETSVSLLRKTLGFSYSHGLLLYNGHKGRFYFPRKEAQEINGKLIDKLKHDISFGESINRNIIIKSVELENIWKRYASFCNFSDLSLDELYQLYVLQLQQHYELYQFGWIPEILQDADYGIDHWLVDIIKKYDPHFSHKDILTVFPDQISHTVYLKHELALLRILEMILADVNLKALFSLPVKYIRTILPYKVKERIRQLINKYGYLGYHGYDERKPYNINYYLEKIKQYVEDEDEFITFRNRLHSSPMTSDLWNKLSEEEKRLFRIYNNWGATKSRRRLAQLRNFYFLDMLIEELSYRKRVPEDYIRFMTPAEVKDLFLHDILPSGIEYRPKSCLYYLDENDCYICTEDNFEAVIEEEKYLNTQIVLRGNIACGGFQIGKAYLIERKSEIFSKEIGNDTILVAREADPDIFIIFDKVKAIVTDQGGITCHVASLAREYGIPCIVGTRFATEKIRQGDIIEVDAFSGTVKILE